jgi:diguanylate cyclase (GGDEF)-like protein/PAS domain S-box-containing protein
MNPDHLLYATGLLLSASTCVVFIVLAWQRREAPAGRALMVMMAATAFWAFSYALNWLFPDNPAEFFWLDATYLGVVIAPPTFLVFAAHFNQLDRWLSRRILPLLYLIPALTLILLWTDPYHGLFFDGKRLPGATDIFEGGPWYYVGVIYFFAMVIIGYIFMLIGYSRQHGIYRRQALLIMLGSLIAPAVGLLGVLGLSPLPGLDLIPMVFTILGAFYTLGLLRLSMFDIVPVAKQIVFDTMQEGMLVIDHQFRLVEMNASAEKLLHCERDAAIGKAIGPLLNKWQHLQGQWQQVLSQSGQQTLQDDEGRTYAMRIKPLAVSAGKANGWLVTWNEITDLANAEQLLVETNQQLQVQLTEIEALQAELKQQVIRDPLTNLYNRRFLMETLPTDIARARRKHYTICFLMYDIDGFKQLNDQYGHPEGDLVLMQLAQLCKSMSRDDDYIIRMGGEEFMIVMVDIDKQVALTRAEDFCRAVAVHEFSGHKGSHHITISIGVAAYPDDDQDAQMVIRLADEALYRAKAAGKNCVSQ